MLTELSVYDIETGEFLGVIDTETLLYEEGFEGDNLEGATAGSNISF